MNQKDAQAIPAWLRHFLVHVVKRSLAIALKWIDDMQNLTR